MFLLRIYYLPHLIPHFPSLIFSGKKSFPLTSVQEINSRKPEWSKIEVDPLEQSTFCKRFTMTQHFTVGHPSLFAHIRVLCRYGSYCDNDFFYYKF